MIIIILARFLLGHLICISNFDATRNSCAGNRCALPWWTIPVKLGSDSGLQAIGDSEGILGALVTGLQVYLSQNFQSPGRCATNVQEGRHDVCRGASSVPGKSGSFLPTSGKLPPICARNAHVQLMRIVSNFGQLWGELHMA
jgi:hypothetical protein